MFQGDYLLIQLLSTPPTFTLHRVAQGIIMQEAQRQDAAFTTEEYKHTFQVGVQGLWGTFAPKQNTSNSRDSPRSGTKFCRRARLNRS
eukprot:4220475-Pleurochrysis_carterae.AAC.1